MVGVFHPQWNAILLNDKVGCGFSLEWAQEQPSRCKSRR